MATPFPVGEQQISGVQDDGSFEGAIRAKLVSGELIKVPAVSLEWVIGSAGTGAGANSQNMWYNTDGSDSCINLTISAGLGTSLAYATTSFFGRVVGIRWRKLQNNPAFSVIIDGISYGIPAYNLSPYYTNILQGTERENLFIIVKDLPDGQHSLSVVVPPDASASKTVSIFGLICERRAGYSERPRMDMPYGAGSLTAAAAIVPQQDSNSFTVKGIRSILYTNTDSVPRTVFIQWAGITQYVLQLAAAALYAPVVPVITPSTSGGTLAAATYFYKITALNANGETMGGPEASVTNTGSTSSNALSWTAVVGASSYRIYRGVATGAQTLYFTSLTNSFTDTGGASTAGTVPITSPIVKDHSQRFDPTMFGIVIGDSAGSAVKHFADVTTVVKYLVLGIQ